MGVYTYISAFAAALQASTTIKTYCTTRWGKGCLVQIDENPNDPIRDDSAPFLTLLAWPSSELGPVIGELRYPILLTAGCLPLSSATTPTLVTVTTARTASANGLQSWGAATEAEGLLAAAISAIKGVKLTGSIVSTVTEESNGWMFYPLQTASAVLTIGESNTF